MTIQLLSLPIIESIDNSNAPNKFIAITHAGEILVTRNFSDDFPEWRRYKRTGWAIRYMNNIQRKRRDS